MARPATGQVVVDKRRRSPTFGLRFRACGRREYVALGTAAEGWTQAKAQTELQNVLADVRRGIWRPPAPDPAPEIDQDPTFHEFASQWFESTKGEWREKTRLDYEWQLSGHLLPFFKSHHLSQITIAEVDRYRQSKVAEARAIQVAAAKGEPLTYAYTDKHGRARKRSRRALSVTSINKTITRLGQILEVAVEYGLIGANPAKGRRRRLKPQKAAPVWLDRAEHIEALLDGAGELDHHAKTKGGHDQKGGLVYRRALLSTLVFAGLRIGELTALQWRDVDLAGNRLTVRASKTDAGLRQVDLLPALHDELAAFKTQAPSTAPNGFVFTTAAGSELIHGNIRRRVLDKAVAKANEKLIEAGEVPLPEGLTPHKLRHTFASILVALGVDPGSVMDQLGHTDPGFTLRVYRHGMRRDGSAKERLRALVGGAEWAAMGSSQTQTPWTELAASSGQRLKAA
jgi:integrase